MKENYAVVGNPVEHSKSPEIHALFAQQTGQNIDYGKVLAPLDNFRKTVLNFAEKGGKGLNVTVPFKFEAFAMASESSLRAKMAGAANTLRFEKDGIYCDNTDGAGLVADIQKNAGFSLAGKRILLLGSGGAAFGIMLPILDQKPESVLIANIEMDRAQELAGRFSQYGRLGVSAYEDLKERYDLVINATSAGLSGQKPPVPAAVFGAGTLAIDLVYSDKPTPFMSFAAENGAAVRDGFGMLVEQAAESFKVWRGILPDTAPVFRHFGR